MSKVKSLALAGMLAAVTLAGSSAYAANTAPTSAKDMQAHCEKEAKAKGLTGEALKAAEKKCHDEYKARK